MILLWQYKPDITLWPSANIKTLASGGISFILPDKLCNVCHISRGTSDINSTEI